MEGSRFQVDTLVMGAAWSSNSILLKVGLSILCSFSHVSKMCFPFKEREGILGAGSHSY